MEKILFLAHTEPDGGLAKTALEALQATTNLVAELPDAALTVALFGAEAQAAADAIATCGAQRFLAVVGPDFEAPRYATDATAATALIQAADPTVVLAPSTSRLCRALPGAAHRVDGRVDAHVAGISVTDEGVVARRWYYRQRMTATFTRDHRPWLLLLDSGVAEPWHGDPASAAVEPITPELDASARRTTVEGIVAADVDAQTIRPDADLLFVAGAGWTKRQPDGETHPAQAEALIQGFLDRTQASLGGSKSLVEQGSKGEAVLTFMSHLNQVGQTGSTPHHPKGLSTCCHGEEPHAVGWRFITERRAVNLDASCGWAQGKADVLYVADAFEVIARVNELLQET